MGSRSFYEGWDSNRPNVINFVNIGVGDDAKKFILQAVGRGVRVQSWKGERRRFEELSEDFENKKLFRDLKPGTVHPETLYVLGTSREALKVVLEELKKEKPDMQQFLRLELNKEAGKRLLLVPQYRDKGTPLIEERVPSKFEIAGDDFNLLESYGTRTPDNRVMRQRELDKLRGLNDDDIVHFKQIAVDKVHAEEIQRRVDKVIYAKSDDGKKAAAAIWKQVEQLEMDFSGKAQELNRLIEEQGLSERQTYNEDIGIEYLANHYYLPVIYSLGKRLDYIRHIIDAESEVRFLRLLRDYTQKSDCALRQLDWWNFSKLDQYLDTPCIPYYDPKQNRMARFIPDFIFWGQKGSRYTLLFVDPKGLQNIDWERKVDGFQRMFEEAGKPKVFAHGDMEVTVRLVLFTNNRGLVPEGSYKRYWQDDVKQMFREVFGV